MDFSFFTSFIFLFLFSVIVCVCREVTTSCYSHTGSTRPQCSAVLATSSSSSSSSSAIISTGQCTSTNQDLHQHALFPTVHIPTSVRVHSLGFTSVRPTPVLL
eukprot:Pompholyxophrys_punicea_v1_NODE_69_length_3835_cov_3.436772.p5 type:complete len:103 gc:universal NODE_69_length_3835_cov_3.436772:2762-3070(+)